MSAAVGARNVEAAKALSGPRSWEATLARVKAGWARRALVLTADGCHQLPEGQSWSGLRPPFVGK